MSEWRISKPCDNCPFNTRGDGLRLRKSLRRGRWADILRGLRMGEAFECHKTVDFDDEGEQSKRGLMCAGAIAWQEERNCTSQLQRIMERMEARR